MAACPWERVWGDWHSSVEDEREERGEEKYWTVSFIMLFCAYPNPYTGKRIGCFNLWMVTLVVEKLRRLWLWEVYVGIANCISNLSPNRTLQQPEHLWGSHYNYTSSWRLSRMFSSYYICKIIACFLIQAGVTPSSVVILTARSWL